MAYNSKFKIETDAWSLEEIRGHLRQLSGYSFYVFEKALLNEDKVSWYEWEEHVAVLAQRFPSFTFVVTRSGEDSGDLYRAYFKGAEKVVHRAAFPTAPSWVPVALAIPGKAG